MAKSLYALLIGINQYNNPLVSNLQGCVNDALSIEELLKSRYKHHDLRIEKLLDTEATYRNIIQLFRSHLGKAGKDDIVLFHYSGHGAREITADPFREFFSENNEETLVCHDSRTENGYDLADKELAVLLSEVARKDPRIAVILDCCHSGSGTRVVDDFTLGQSRKTYQRTDSRPLETYLDGWYTKQQQENSRFFIPESKHILLAACDRTQEARETAVHSGVFSTALLNVLNKSANISYADLFLETRREILNLAINQTPQFECYNYFNAYSEFLDYATSDAAEINSVYFEEGSWNINCGAMKGISTEPHTETSFAIFPSESIQCEDIEIAGYGTAITVNPDKSLLKLNFKANTEFSYKAKPISIPPAKFSVFIDAPDDFIEAIKELCPKNLQLDFKTDKPGTKYCLKIEADSIKIFHVDSGMLIHGAKADCNNPANNIVFKDALVYIFSVFDKLLNWERGIDIVNKKTQISEKDIDLKIVETANDGTEIELSGNNITLDFEKKDGDWKEIRCKIKVRNNLNREMHCSLLYFSSGYGIHALRNEPLEARSNFVTLWGEADTDYFYLPDESNEATDIFKIIVSTDKVDDFLLEQEGISLGEIVSGVRAIGTVKPGNKVTNDWTTKTIIFKTIRQLNQVSENNLNLANGQITIKGNSIFKAKIGLTSANPHTRSTDITTTIANVIQQSGNNIIDFKQSRGESENILELTDIQNESKLKDNPFEIVLNTQLNEDEIIVPFTFDGDDIIPIGDTQIDDNGNTIVSIDNIPDYKDNNRRSLGKALKLSFFKFIGKKSGLQQLRYVDFLENKKIKRISYGLKEKIKEAEKIILVIHGIIGDSELIAQSLRFAQYKEKPDLVLTYDYENLVTKIQDSSQRLKELLHDAGINDKAGKKITIVAHSSGGLLARHLVEKLDGNRFVEKVILAGVPNKGSVIDNIVEYRTIATTVLTFGIGIPAVTVALPVLIPVASAMLLVMNRSKKLTVSLEQMVKDSEFIRELSLNKDPGVLYIIIAGDVDKFKAIEGNNAKGFIEKLQFKLGRISFGDEPNDVIVGMESMKHIDDYRKHKAETLIVACHHFNYFESDKGKQALQKAVEMTVEKNNKFENKM